MSVYRLGAARPQDAEVSVFSVCDCAVCKDPASRWFSCPHIHDRMVGKYACTSVVECVDEGEVFTRDGIPDPATVEEIKKLHPGSVLVYLGA